MSEDFGLSLRLPLFYLNSLVTVSLRKILSSI